VKQSLKLGRNLLTGFLLIVSTITCLPARAQVVIKLGTVAPEGSVWHDALLRIKQEWRDVSHGQVELRIYAGGVLGSEGELVRKLQRQSLDAIALTSSGLPALDKSFQCLNVPMLFESVDNLDYVRAEVAPKIEKRLEQKGFKVLNWAPAGWVQIFSRYPVRTPNDLRKQRIWTSASDPETENLYKKLGFNAVPLPATDVLTSLQTGLIDAMPMLPLFVLVERSYTVANNMTVLNWSPLNSAMVITMRAWERIPADLQPRLLAIARAEGKALGAAAERAGDSSVKEMQARGLKVLRLSDNEMAQWRAETEKAYPMFRGLLCPDDMFDEVIHLEQVYRHARGGTP
jgi:TRAP-type C4-dicarboxylate transport system substrate-binding protein